MAFFARCMRYPCPYDPEGHGPSPPKYHFSLLTSSSDKPPPYSERPTDQIALPKREILPFPRSSSESPYVKRLCRISKWQFACPACNLRCLREVLRQWVLKQRKPYTAITVQIDRLTSEQYDENDIGGIVDLIEVIRLQDSGPTEAARALRKKL